MKPSSASGFAVTPMKSLLAETADRAARYLAQLRIEALHPYLRTWLDWRRSEGRCLSRHPIPQWFWLCWMISVRRQP